MKLKSTIADLGFSIGMGCGLSLGISTVALVGSLSFQGIIWVGNGLERIKPPIQRFGVIAGIIIGASAGGCVLGCLMSTPWRKEEELVEVKKELTVSNSSTSKDAYINLLEQKLDFAQAGYKHHEQYLKAQIEEKDRTIKQLRSEFSQLRGEFLELRDIRVHLDNVRTLDNRYNILDCYGCKHFYGKEDEEKYFVCAMHPYGQKDCGDREGLRSEL